MRYEADEPADPAPPRDQDEMNVAMPPVDQRSAGGLEDEDDVVEVFCEEQENWRVQRVFEEISLQGMLADEAYVHSMVSRNVLFRLEHIAHRSAPSSRRRSPDIEITLEKILHHFYVAGECLLQLLSAVVIHRRSLCAYVGPPDLANNAYLLQGG